MATPKWTYNRLIRNINDIQQVMSTLDQESQQYKKLKQVSQSLNGLAVLVKKNG